jgi:hypothetical protein
MADTQERDALVSLLAKIRDWMVGVLGFVEDTAARDAAFAELGIATSAAGPDLSSVNSPLAQLDSQLATQAGFAATAEALVVFSEALGTTLAAPDSGMAATDIVYGLTQLYALTSIRVRNPEIWAVFEALGFIGDIGFNFANIAHFIDDTGSYLDSLTSAGAPDDETKAANWSLIMGALMGAASILIPYDGTKAWTVQTLYGWDRDPASTHPNADAVLSRMASLQIRFAQAAAHTEEKFTLTTAVVPPAHGGWGFYGALSAEAAWTIAFGDYWELKLDAAIPDGLEFFIAASDARDASAFQRGSGADLSFKATFRRSDKQKSVAKVGNPNGSHLEFDKLNIELALATSGQSIVMRTKGTALVIDIGDGDGFLQKVLPRQLRLESDLGIGLDSKRGFFIDGGTKLEATIPINKPLGGFRVDHLTAGIGLATQPGEGANFALELSGAFELDLGVLKASVDRLGIALDTQLGKPGNAVLGDVNFHFKPPTGAGLLVDATIVKGGGFLFFDPDKGEYGGVAELKIIGAVDIKAIALISTKLPDGSPGFSLLFILSIEFATPPQIFGFGLLGIGGLIGIQHSVATDGLNAAIHNHSLDNILFPADPVATAPRILQTMRTIFPITPDRYLFGPLFKIGWPAVASGVEPPLKVTLGILLDIPGKSGAGGVRIVILGQIRIALPVPALPIVDLRADLFGLLDFDAGLIEILVSLNDSRLAGFSIGGDILILTRYKADPIFVFSAGGFNKRYVVPAGIPPLHRLSVDISGSDNPRLRLEAYLALTSNSFQFGARLELHAGAGPFSVDGQLGFDALVEWDPKFSFIIEITAGISLSYQGATLLGVSLDFTLAGPAPWDAAGDATITILFWDVHGHFHVTWGSDANSTPPPAVELVGQVAQALAAPGSWEGRLPVGADAIVTLADRTRDGIIVHPLGALTLRQRVAPLGVKLDRLGHAGLANARRAELGTPVFGPQKTPAQTASTVSDKFAAAQYLDISDDAKISRPAFEDFQSGLQISPVGEQVGTVIEDDVTYETKILHAQRLLIRSPLRFDHASTFASFGAAGRSPTAFSSRYATPVEALPRAPLTIAGAESSTVVSRHDLTAASLNGLTPAAHGATYTLAAQALDRHLAAHPALADSYVLVGAHEARSAP